MNELDTFFVLDSYRSDLDHRAVTDALNPYRASKTQFVRIIDEKTAKTKRFKQ